MVHDAGARYIGSINGRGFYFQQMDNEAMRQLDGELLKHGGMNQAIYKCSLNPKTQRAFLLTARHCIDAGMDGLILDSWQGEARQLCFCRWCTEFYRKSLKENRQDPRLAELVDINADAFDYGGYLRSKGFDAKTPIHKLPFGPVFQELRFRELLQQKRSLLTKIRQYAQRRRRMPFTLTANVYSMRPMTFAIADLLDYFSVELPYFGTFNGYPPQCSSIALLKKAQAVGKRCVVQPGCHDTPDPYGFVIEIRCKDCNHNTLCDDMSGGTDGDIGLWNPDCFENVCGGVPTCTMCGCGSTHVIFPPNLDFLPPDGDYSQTDSREFFIGGEALTNPYEYVIVKAHPKPGYDYHMEFVYFFGLGECEWVVRAEAPVSVEESITWRLTDPDEQYDLPGYVQMNRDYDEESVYQGGAVADNIGFCDDGQPCGPYALDFLGMNLVDTPEETDNKLIMKTTFARAERLAREYQYKIDHSHDCGSGDTTDIAIWDEQAPGNYIFVKRDDWIDIDLPSDKKFYIEGLGPTCRSVSWKWESVTISLRTEPLESGEPGFGHDCPLELDVEPDALVRVVKVDLAIDSDGGGSLDGDPYWGNGVNTDEFIEENVADDDTQGIEKARAFVGLNDDWDEGRLGTGGLPELDNEGTEYILSSDEDLDYMQFRLYGLGTGDWSLEYDESKILLWILDNSQEYWRVNSGTRYDIGNSVHLDANQGNIRIEAISPSAYVNDLEIKAKVWMDGQPNPLPFEDKLVITAVQADLDIDSDNDNQTDPPDGSQDEDRLEADPNHHGKIIAVNNDDDDRDGVLDVDDNDLTDEDDFIPIVMDVKPTDFWETPISWSLNYDETKIKVWAPVMTGHFWSRALCKDPGSCDPGDCPEIISKVVWPIGGVFYVPSGQMFDAPDPNGDPPFVHPQLPHKLYVEGIAPGEVEIEFNVRDGHEAENLCHREIASDKVRLTVVNIGIAMDGDQDLQIDFANPRDLSCLFWINADRDVRHVEFDWGIGEDRPHEDDYQVSSPPTIDADCYDSVVGEGCWMLDEDEVLEWWPCLRDLEDLIRLHLYISDVFQSIDDVTFHLVIQGGPATANLFPAVTCGYGYRYLPDRATDQADEQVAYEVSAIEVQLSPEHIRFGQQRSCFLLEGREAGTGDLSLVVRISGQEVMRRSVAIDLRPISAFYYRYQVTGEIPPTESTEINTPTYDPPVDEFVLHVHGWNMPDPDKDFYAHTMFKRLWWQGYRGHFGSYEWPTLEGVTTYNSSELRAWYSATALMNRIQQLNGQFPNEVRLTAHSMGNVVAGEAIRQLPYMPFVLNSYLAMQAAVPAHCYDSALQNRNGASTGVPNVYAHYTDGISHAPYFNGSPPNWSKVGLMINYYNEDDYALSLWDLNQTYKPMAELFYHYFERDMLPGYAPNPTNPDLGDEFECAGYTLVFDADRFLIFSFAAPAWSEPLGGEADPVAGFAESRNLQFIGFDEAHYSHSKQFRSNIVDEWTFWAWVAHNLDLALSGP